MTNKFSLDIHAYLSEKIDTAEFQKEEAIKRKNRTDEQYCDGQPQELLDIRQFLSARFDLNTQTYY